MNTRLVDEVRQWFAEHKERLSSAGVMVELMEATNEDATSARIDLESDSKIGYATVWEDGFCDLEILSMETEKQLLYRHYEEFEAPFLRALLDEFAVQFINPT